MTYTFKTKPFAHQKDALDAGRGLFGFAWLMEMGTGKTKVCIDEIGILYTDGEIDCALVLAPKGVYLNWVNNEIPAHLGVKNADVVMWHSGGGNKKQQAELMRVLKPSDRLRIVVMNIEAFSSGTKAVKYATMFLNSGRCHMSVDESTLIKNHTSRRSKNIIEVGKLALYKRIMTGSPVTRSPLDLYAQFEFIDPSVLGARSFYAFRARYAVLQEQNFGGRRVTIVVGNKNLDDLSERIKDYSFRVTKEDCLDLPPKVYTRRDVQMTDEQKRVYAQMRDEAFSEIGDEFVSASAVIVQITRLHQIACGHTKTEDGNVVDIPNNRVSELMEIVGEMQGDVIIWSRWRRDIDKIVEALTKEYGAESVAQYHGGNVKTRDAEADTFKFSPECRFMVSNQQTGGYGNTWTNATNVIYYSNGNNLEHRLQSEDRPHRSGQEHSVLYVDMCVPGTVEEKIIHAMRNNIDIGTAIMGDNYRDWIV